MFVSLKFIFNNFRYIYFQLTTKIKPHRPRLTISTSIVFFHRFFSRQSFKFHSRFDVATACVFLASKVDETPRKVASVGEKQEESDCVRCRSFEMGMLRRFVSTLYGGVTHRQSNVGFRYLLCIAARRSA